MGPPSVQQPATSTPVFADALRVEANGEITFKGKRYRALLLKGDSSPPENLTDQEILAKVIEVLKSAGAEKLDSLANTEISADGSVNLQGKVVPVDKPDDLKAKITSIFQKIFPTKSATKIQMQAVEYDPKIHMPLFKNSDNRCYLDAALHLLLAVKGTIGPKLAEAIVKRQTDLAVAKQGPDQAKPDPNKDELLILLNRLNEIFKAINAGNQDEIQKKMAEFYKLLNDSNFATVMKKKFDKQDAAELVEFLMEKIGSYLFIAELGPKSKFPRSPEGHSLLKFPFPKDPSKASLDHMIAEFAAAKANGTKTQAVLGKGEAPPDVIFVQLPRVDDKGKPVAQPIDFQGKNKDLKFNLLQAFTCPDPASLKEEDFVYEIAGAICHRGDHFAAKVKHEDSKKWYYCDDLKQKNEELNTPFSDSDQKEAYVIVLKRIKK